MSEELKPCPFTGEKPVFSMWTPSDGRHRDYAAGVWIATIASSEISIEKSSRGGEDDAKSAAIAAWNRRATLSPAHIEDEREAFEASYCAELEMRGGRIDRAVFTRDAVGDYIVPGVQSAWWAWQARAAFSAPPAAGVPEGWRELAQQAADALQVFTGHDSGPNLRHRYGKNWWEPLDQLRDKLRAMLKAPTPPASEQQQTIHQPHTVEFVGKTCQRVLMAEGKPYPRTCAVCGLFGPCKSFPRENEQRLNPHLAKGEGV